METGSSGIVQKGGYIDDMLWRRPFTRLTRLQILSAGPSFRPMYFIIMSLLSRSSALPSISCFRNRSACTASDGSCAAIKCITSSMVQSLVCPRGICTCTGAGVTTAVVIVVTVPAAGTIVLGGIVGTCPVRAAEEDDDGGQAGDGTKGTARVCVLWGMIVFGRGVTVVVEVCAGCGVGTGAMFAVGVTCGEGVAWAGDRADADEDEAAAMAAAAATAAAVTADEPWRSVLTAMLGGVGVEVASGDTTIVDEGVG